MTQFDTFLHQSIATLQLQCISILHNVWFPVLLQVLDFPPFISDILPTADGTTAHVIGYNPPGQIQATAHSIIYGKYFKRMLDAGGGSSPFLISN